MDINRKNIKELVLNFIKHKSFQNFIIIGSIAVLQLINNVYLGRVLTKDEFGQYSFVFLNIVNLFSVLFLFGMGTSIMRHFSTESIFVYKWKKNSGFFLSVISIPVFIGSLIIKVIYDLNTFWFTMMFLGSYLSCVTVLVSYIFKSQGKYNLSEIIGKSTSIVFIIAIGISLLVSCKMDLYSLSIVKLISFSLVMLIALYLFLFKENGNKKIGKDVVLDGFAFWEMSLTVLAMNYIDALLIAKILNYKDLALYSIMLSVMQIFEFTRQSISNVYVHKFSQKKHINIIRLSKTILVVAILLSVFYLVSTNLLLEVLFDGKYSAPLLLIGLFCVLSSINLFYIIPSCYLTGKSKRKDLRFMLVCNVISLVLKIVFILMLKKYGLIGFVLSGVVSQGFRTLCGYLIILIRRQELHNV